MQHHSRPARAVFRAEATLRQHARKKPHTIQRIIEFEALNEEEANAIVAREICKGGFGSYRLARLISLERVP